MLSRTADNLFWLSRYVERAEYLARILDATQRLSALPLAYVGTSNEWESAVLTAGCATAFFKQYEEANEENVTDFLAFSTANSSSIRNCFELARSNARAVRTALTVEMWDAINGTWLELKRYGNGPTSRVEFSRFLRWVQESSLRYDGSAYRTMLRNDAYWFSRLGVYLERADNTARILDVKYHLLLPDNERVGGPLDYFQWAAILRSVSALTAYHWVYRDSLQPWLVADLLILKEEMPRSLASCYEAIVRNLDSISGAYGRQGPAQRQAFLRIDDAGPPQGRQGPRAGQIGELASVAAKPPDHRAVLFATPALVLARGRQGRCSNSRRRRAASRVAVMFRSMTRPARRSTSHPAGPRSARTRSPGPPPCRRWPAARSTAPAGGSRPRTTTRSARHSPSR